MSTTKKQVNGVNQLTSQQEQMRMEVVDLELKARYWEAQWKIKFYTLEATKLQGEYDTYIQEAQKQEAEARQKYEEYIKQIQENSQVEGAANLPTEVPTGIEVTEQLMELEENVEGRV